MTIFGWCSLKAPLGSRDNPSHSQCISFNVTFLAHPAYPASERNDGPAASLRSKILTRPIGGFWLMCVCDYRRRTYNGNTDPDGILVLWWQPVPGSSFVSLWHHMQDTRLFRRPDQAWAFSVWIKEDMSPTGHPALISIRILPGRQIVTGTSLADESDDISCSEGSLAKTGSSGCSGFGCPFVCFLIQ